MIVRLPRALLSGKVGAAVFLGIAFLGAYWMAQTILSENTRELVIVLAFASSALLAFFILADWRFGVGVFFFWLVLEDMVRKYMGNSLIVYATKDVLIAVTYVSYLLLLMRKREEIRVLRNPLRVPLLLWFLWAVIEAFNPHIDNLLVPILGLRMSFLYVPMIYLGYSFFKEERHFRVFTLSILSLAGLLAVFGILQAQYGLELMNPEAGPYLVQYLVRYVPGTGQEVPRPTATFVNAGRYAQYLFVMMYVGFGLLLYLHLSRGLVPKWARRWALACWMLITMALLLSGQRSAILWVLLSAIPLGLAHVYIIVKTRQSWRALPLARIALAGLVTIVALGVMVPERFDAASSFYVESIDPMRPHNEMSSRPATIWRDIGVALSASPVMGQGTGSASLGLQYIYQDRSQYLSILAQVEGGYAAVIWEWGLVGLALWLWWSGLLIFLLIRKVKQLVGTPYYWFAVVTSVCVFVILFPWFAMGVQVYQNYVTQAFFWFLVGVLFRLPDVPAAEPALAPRRFERPLAFVQRGWAPPAVR